MRLTFLYLFPIFPFQVHVVGWIQAPIHPFPIPSNPTLDQKTLGSGLHYKLFNIIHHFDQIHAKFRSVVPFFNLQNKLIRRASSNWSFIFATVYLFRELFAWVGSYSRHIEADEWGSMSVDEVNYSTCPFTPFLLLRLLLLCFHPEWRHSRDRAEKGRQGSLRGKETKWDKLFHVHRIRVISIESVWNDSSTQTTRLHSVTIINLPGSYGFRQGSQVGKVRVGRERERDRE